MYLVFNELSVYTEICRVVNTGDAQKKINEFIELIHTIKKENLIQGFVCTPDIFSFRISQEYGIREWLSDPLVNCTYKQLFRVYSNRCICIQPDDYLNEFIVEVESRPYKGTGCLVAAENKDSVISVKTSVFWDSKTITGLYTQIDEEANISYSEKSITNISKTADVDIIRDQIKLEKFDGISSGQDLWEQCNNLFPNLIFCDCVKDQLYKDPEKYHILRVIEKLKVLQQYFSSYNGKYDHKDIGLNARSESETVKSSNDLKDKRLFRKPNGDEDYFFDHIGFTGKYTGGRIYFQPDDCNRKCYIGYIGRHLQTKKF